MTPQELKASILQLAIQGKLVEQRPEEGTGAELLEKILAAKNAKCAKGGSRSRATALMTGGTGETGGTGGTGARHASPARPSSPPAVPPEDAPFDIPESWVWVKIGDVFNLQAGKNIKSEHIFPTPSPKHRYPCYGGNGCRGYVADYNRSGHYALIGRQGALCGNINFAEGKFYATEHAVVVEQFAGTSVIWCGYFLQALNLNQYATATAQPGLAVSNINQVLIPLPPLAEQKRIVAKIEELLPLIDRYEKAWGKLEDFNRRFPVDMQKSLLQLAIQGKLVEQCPEEGTGEELYRQILAHKKALFGDRQEGKLSNECFKEDEIPFPIPDTWKWVRFGHIMINRDAERIPLSVDERAKLKKKFDYYGASGVIDKVDRYLFDKKLLLIGEDGANLLTRSTPIAFLAQGKYWVNNHAHVLDYSESCLCVEYVMWYINAINLAPYVTGTAQPKMNQQKMNSIPVPLPPLAEQKRIVAKLEELLPLCERLK